MIFVSLAQIEERVKDIWIWLYKSHYDLAKHFAVGAKKNTKSIFFYLDLSLPMVKKATGCIYTSGKSGLHSACMQ